MNFELHDWALGQRINALCGGRPECQYMGDTLAVWNLRGKNADLNHIGTHSAQPYHSKCVGERVFIKEIP